MNKKNNKLDTKIYFMPIGMCVDMIIGTIVGVQIKNVFPSICIAISIGTIVGLIIDNIFKK